MAHAEKRKSDSRASSPQRPVRFNVKLATGGTRENTLDKTEGVLRVDPLFPDEEDEDLATIYVVEIGSKDADTVVERLEKDPHVEYVERPAPRKLIRSASR